MGIGTVFSSQISFKISIIQAVELCLLHSTDDPNLIPRAHVEVEDNESTKLPSNFHMCYVACMHSHPHITLTHSNNSKLKFLHYTNTWFAFHPYLFLQFFISQFFVPRLRRLHALDFYAKVRSVVLG